MTAKTVAAISALSVSNLGREGAIRPFQI